jgi:hypothetical protein
MKKTLTLLLLFISVGGFAQKVSITLNLKTDSTYSLLTNATLSIIEDLNGQQQIINTIIDANIAHKVTSIKDSIYEMEVQYKSMGIHMEMGGKKIMDISSGNTSADDLPSKLLSAMLNKPFFMTITKTGKVMAVKNIENLYAGMFDSLPQVTEAQKAQFKSQMQQSFGDKAIKTNFQETFAMFPAVAVSLNGSWVTNNSLESVVTVKTKTTYTLKDITDNALLIHGDAVILSDGNTGYKPLNGMSMRFINVTGSATTELRLNKNTGWIMEAKVEKTIKGTVEVQDSPKTPGGMTFPMSVIADMTVSDK